MNRQQRRALAKRVGRPWGEQRVLDAAKAAGLKAPTSLTGVYRAAHHLTRAQAREALAKWAAAGGKGGDDGRE